MKPLIKITANGGDITHKINDRLIALTIIDKAGMQSDSLQLVLDNRDHVFGGITTGAELAVSIGYEKTSMADMGLYVVDEYRVSGPPAKLTIAAHAANLSRAMQKQHKTRSWDKKTIGDIVTAIAAEHGLTPAIAPKYANITIAHIDQTNESDLHFLSRIAVQNNAVAKPANGHLLFVARGEAKSASGATMPTLDITKRNITTYEIRFADRDKYQSVKARWHNQQ
ncbi:MAG: contractile injection system protein, VgrG/Pvc8 family [Pseudomonadota bacterium]